MSYINRGRSILRRVEDLLRLYGDDLKRLALRLTGDECEAEELYQETIEKICKNVDSLSGVEKIKKWLCKVMVNTFINHRNKKSAVLEVLESELCDEQKDLEAICYINGVYVDLEKEIFSKVVDDEIAEAINRLPEHYRTVFLLVDVEEMSYKEVMSLLNISMGTLSSRLYRARRMLRDMLYDYAKERGLIEDGER